MTMFAYVESAYLTSTNISNYGPSTSTYWRYTPLIQTRTEDLAIDRVYLHFNRIDVFSFYPELWNSSMNGTLPNLPGSWEENNWNIPCLDGRKIRQDVPYNISRDTFASNETKPALIRNSPYCVQDLILTMRPHEVSSITRLFNRIVATEPVDFRAMVWPYPVEHYSRENCALSGKYDHRCRYIINKSTSSPLILIPQQIRTMFPDWDICEFGISGKPPTSRSIRKSFPSRLTLPGAWDPPITFTASSISAGLPDPVDPLQGVKHSTAVAEKPSGPTTALPAQFDPPMPLQPQVRPGQGTPSLPAATPGPVAQHHAPRPASPPIIEFTTNSGERATAVQQQDGGFVVGDTTIRPNGGLATLSDGTHISLSPQGEFVVNNVAAAAPSRAANGVGITFSGKDGGIYTAILNEDGSYSVDNHKVVSGGGSMTLPNGPVISAAAGAGLVVDGKTMRPSALPSSSSQGSSGKDKARPSLVQGNLDVPASREDSENVPTRTVKALESTLKSAAARVGSSDVQLSAWLACMFAVLMY